jgi:ABC-type glycerol-3-phosphate transport system substrate-binding protein
VRPLALLLTTLALAGCGRGSSSTTTLYAGGDWKVVLDGDQATAFHRVADSWQADTTGAVKIRILGPDGDVASTPQVAAELSAKKPLIESGMWVDGKELVVKGGGLTATKGTIYGAPGAPLAKGTHVAVAYARTTQHATAVAWSFRVV